VGDDGTRQAVIRTVHGRGYRFLPDVVEHQPGSSRTAGPEPQAPLGEAEPEQPRQPVEAGEAGEAGEQQIRFCRSSDGVGLAYAIHGTGPCLVKAANWLTHLDYDWHSPVWRHWLHTLGRTHTVLRYDERGCGLSDRDIDDFSLDAWVRDLEAVVDDAGVDRFPLLGISQGAAVAIAYTVAHPERVSRLVLYGSYVQGLLTGSSSERRRQEAKVMVDMARVGWGRRSPAFRHLFSAAFMPEGTVEQWHAFDELQRQSTSPENAARFLEAFFRLDVRDLAPQVTVPTLVLHCRGDEVWPFELGRRLAAEIPDSRLVPLESRNHLLFEHEPAWARFVAEVERFLADC
jgi:pimeloyl-ACP methyl ester carboxylesterase